jgi:hypothetical protein
MFFYLNGDHHFYMKYYFQLQFLRLNRFLKESGFHPVLAYLLLLVIFSVISHLTINSIENGAWVYALLSIYLFLKTQNIALVSLIFSNSELRKIRLVEAIIFFVPFSVMLLINQFFFEGLLLMLSIPFSAQFRLRNRFSFKMPTPFYKHPFEFIMGFRSTWAILLMSLGLSIIAITVENYNLTVFSIALIYLNFSVFYSKSEHVFFVWIYSMNPQQFLSEKVRIALLFSVLSTTPIIIATYVVFPDNWMVTTLLLLSGSILPILGILNKYSYFPSHSELINSILIGFSLLFPPFLLFMIPYLIYKATNNLKNYL